MAGKDRPLQFFYGRGHAGEALAELVDGEALFLKGRIHRRRVPTVDRDFLHTILFAEGNDVIHDRAMVHHVAGRVREISSARSATTPPSASDPAMSIKASSMRALFWRMQERLAQAQHKPTGPRRGQPGWE